MTSAATLHCPFCMAEVPKRMVANVPGLILIDRYYCWKCGHMTIREELVQETTLNVLRSGRNPLPPIPQNTTVNLGGEGLSDGPSFLTATTFPPFTPLPNELVVATIASVGDGTDAAPDSVTCGGTPMVLASYLAHGPGALSGSMWYLPNAPQVSSQVVATWSGSTDAAITVLRFYSYTTLVHTAQGVTTDPPDVQFDSGFTPTQTGTGHLAVAMGAADGDTASDPGNTFDAAGTGMIAQASVSTTGLVVGPVGVICGRKFISNTDPARSLGDADPSPHQVAIVAVFKP